MTSAGKGAPVHRADGNGQATIFMQAFSTAQHSAHRIAAISASRKALILIDGSRRSSFATTNRPAFVAPTKGFSPPVRTTTVVTWRLHVSNNAFPGIRAMLARLA